MLGKGQQQVGAAIHEMSKRLAFAPLGLDPDNGGDFINHLLYAYCQRNKITFTRSGPTRRATAPTWSPDRSGKWSVLRRLIGYDHYTSKEALGQLSRVYRLARRCINFFQPTTQPQHKSRHRAKVHKVYDTARTPYQRLLE